ncbi:hypothetical protein V6N13_064679 [Hibiscus sabdariffa]
MNTQVCKYTRRPSNKVMSEYRLHRDLVGFQPTPLLEGFYAISLPSLKLTSTKKWPTPEGSYTLSGTQVKAISLKLLHTRSYQTTINIDLPAQVPTAAHYLAEIPTAVTPAQVPAAAYYLPKFLPTVPATALPPKTDLARRIDRSKRRRLTFMTYHRDFNKAIIQVIKDKFPESSTRSQCLNRNLPTSLPWHHIPARQKLNFPVEGIFSRRGQKMEQQIKTRLGAVLKQFRLITFRTRQGQQL